MSAPSTLIEGPTIGRQSALSGRISTVLSTSYSDLEIRDAVAVLDQRGFKNTAESRRQLRLDIQDEVIKRNGEVLSDFGGVVNELRRVDVILSRISNTCATLRSHIEEANRMTAPMRGEAADLLVQKREAETKQQILNAFESHFVLSEAEETVLTSSSDPIDGEFFSALAKLKRIHADSQVLLPASSDRLGLSILDQSSKILNTAFQKLFRWTQKEFRILDLENPRLSASMRRALRVLAERPAMFNSSLDNFASTRETTLSNAFHSALTGQGDDFVQKPIEFQAHDPLRYISDMLAWVHSATIGEREALEVLFIAEGEELAKGIQEGKENDPWSRNVPESPDIEAFDGRKALGELVSRDIAGVSRLLRQRAEHVIQSQEDALVAFRIANLLAFYKNTFTKLLGAESDVMNTLKHLEGSAQRQFRVAMSDSVALMKPDLQVTPTDTNPPEYLKEALETLRHLLQSYDTSVGATSAQRANSDSDSTEIGITALLNTALTPFLEGTESQWSKLPPPKQDILALNALLDTLASLSPYAAHTAPALEALEARIKDHAASLTDHVHSFLQQASGLQLLVTDLLALPDNASIAEFRALPVLAPEALREAGASLDAFLPEALVEASEEMKGLHSAKLAKEVLEEAAERFCDEFEDIEERILAVDRTIAEEKGSTDEDDDDEESRKPTLRELFPRTSAEIRVLLS
jgi:conserved oligomeric Golgi complex subunit 6